MGPTAWETAVTTLIEQDNKYLIYISRHFGGHVVERHVRYPDNIANITTPRTLEARCFPLNRDVTGSDAAFAAPPPPPPRMSWAPTMPSMPHPMALAATDIPLTDRIPMLLRPVQPLLGC